MSDHNFVQEEKRHKINHLSVIAKFGTVVQFDGTVLDYIYWAIKKWNKCHVLHIDVAELNLTSDDIERCRKIALFFIFYNNFVIKIQINSYV